MADETPDGLPPEIAEPVDERQALTPPGLIPLSKADYTFWTAEIERADTLRNDVIAKWDVKGNLERYTPTSVMQADGKNPDGRVNVGKDFSDVERKKAALFYDTPEIALIPDPGTDGSVLQLHQELLNTLLSSQYMDALATVRPTIQDCLVAIQPVPTEIGYRSVSVQVDQPAPPDPMTGLPAVDPMTGQPAMQQVPVIVWEEIFFSKISPRATLLPVTLKSTKYDTAPWLGYKWQKPISQVEQEYKVTGLKAGANIGTETPYFQPLGDSPDTGEAMIGGVKIWYRANYRDPNVTHPEVIRELELVEGREMPLVHRDCPCQTIGPDGRLTPDSLIGSPLHPLALRDLTDSAFVAADCTLTAPLTHELNDARTDNILQKRGSKLHVLYDPDKLNNQARTKVEEGNAPKFIPVEPGVLDGGVDRVMAQVPALTQGRESFLIQDIIERDRDGILGMNQNTSNPRAQGGKTATEIQTVQRNTDARFEQERNRVLEWWLKAVQKISALALRYGDRMAMDILGPQRGQMWLQARDAGQFSRFSFETVIDSGNYIDIEQRKNTDLKLYEMTAKDPTLNRSILQARLATDFGLDPARWLVTEPPEQKPEPMSMSLSVKVEDLDPLLPSYVNTYAILSAQGIKGLLPPLYRPPTENVMPMEPEHGGMAEKPEHINKHQSDLTGQNPGPSVN
jgi:hypothetical protein